MTYLQPVLLLLIISLALGLSRPQRYRRTAVAATVVFFLWSWMPVAWLLSGTLEWHYTVTQYPSDEAEAIVVLGAGTIRANPSQPSAHVDRNTYLRCQHAVWLYHHWRTLPVVVTGGSASGDAVADLMRRVLQAENVPAAMIWAEEQSTSTYENAVFTAALLRSRGIRKVALVTEAYHMRRSEACFRKQGLIVTPAPCSFNTISLQFGPSSFMPDSRMMSINEDVLHEWVGLVWYTIAGRI